MRRPCNWKKMASCIIITAGVILVSSQLLPTGFWWFLTGAALIVCGLRLRNMR